MPMIEKEIITDINQTNISDKHVNNARKNAIEMYYSLQKKCIIIHVLKQ